MAQAYEDMQRQLERQTNELIGTVHVLETVLSIMLRNLFERQQNASDLIEAMKSEAIATIQSTSSLSGDHSDTLKIQGGHTMIAEGFFDRIQASLPKRGSFQS